MKEISIRLPPYLLKALNGLSGNRSAHIRRAIQEYIMRQRYDPENEIMLELCQRAISQTHDVLLDFYALRVKRKKRSKS